MKKGEQFGNYIVLEDLGAGGMNEVYLARDEETGENVALKILHASHVTDPNVVPRFVREAETYRKLKHPNIVRYVGSGVREQTYFIAIEHVEGKTLDEVMEKKGALGVELTTRVGLDLLRALRHAHQKAIVHRDLKPANVMISREGEVKLVDFGVARADDRLLETRSGDMLGSFQYSSPELNEGRQVDGRSDLYSVGLILWEMLTGKRCLDGPLLEVRKRQKAGEIRSPSSVAGDIPPALDSICRRLLRYDPGERYADAQEAIDELKEFLDMAGLE